LNNQSVVQVILVMKSMTPACLYVLNLVVMVGLVSGLALVHAQEDGGESIVMYQSVLNSVFMESALLQKRAGALQDGKANSVLYQCVPDPVKMVVPA
jgi:hypothetical protein